MSKLRVPFGCSIEQMKGNNVLITACIISTYRDEIFGYHHIAMNMLAIQGLKNPSQLT